MNSDTVIDVVPTEASLGADVIGLNLSQTLDERAFASLVSAWHTHLVLRFRAQELTDAALVNFSRRFGDLDLAPVDANGRPAVPEHPEILIISNVKEAGRAIGSLGSYEAEWHTDMSYNEAPPMMSCLYALEVPSQGGNTGFLNMYKAYETLPKDLKSVVDRHTCKHDASRNSAGELRSGFLDLEDPREVPGAVHPLVVSHPATERRALLLGRRRNAYVPGLPLADSEALLDELWEHATQPQNRWDQVWQVGDLILWDNRCTMHRRDAFDAATRRVMHRTQVQGARPVGVFATS